MSYISLLLCFSFSVFAQTGHDEAAAICTKLTFSDERSECIQIVNKSNFFSVGAVKICSALTFSDDKTKCITSIAGKYYIPVALSTCSAMTFSSDKIKCLAEVGKPYSAATNCDLERLKNRLDLAITLYNRDQNSEAMNQLLNMRDQLNGCLSAQ